MPGTGEEGRVGKGVPPAYGGKSRNELLIDVCGSVIDSDQLPLAEAAGSSAPSAAGDVCVSAEGKVAR